LAKENGKLYAAEIPSADLALNVSSPVSICFSSVPNEKDKDDIKPTEKASEVISALKPVIFHYKKDIDLQGVPQFWAGSRRSSPSESLREND
jgi:hypothetical protein